MSGYGPPRGWRGSNAWGAAPSQSSDTIADGQAVSGEEGREAVYEAVLRFTDAMRYQQQRQDGLGSPGLKCTTVDADGKFVHLTEPQLRAVLAENARMRERLAELTALADELQVATAQNRAARSDWVDLRFGGPDDAAALRATDERLIETQARRSAAQQAWMRAATRYATLDERFAPTKRANAIVLEPDATPQLPASEVRATVADSVMEELAHYDNGHEGDYSETCPACVAARKQQPAHDGEASDR